MANVIPDPRQFDLEDAILRAKLRDLAYEWATNTTVVKDQADVPADHTHAGAEDRG